MRSIPEAPMVGEGWRRAFTDKAAALWTRERLDRLTGGKQLPVTPLNAPCLLRSLGLLDQHADLQPNQVRKFRQVNHMLGFLRPALDELVGMDLTVVDAGCGRSVLGVLFVWFMEQRETRVRLLGLDRNPVVLQGCRERAEMAGQDHVRFAEADLSTVDVASVWSDVFGDQPSLDVVLALHACDTATDDALAMAVNQAARFFAVAPCCQVELSRKWASQVDGPMAPVFTNPHLRRTTAATVTDAMRTELMRSRGFEVRTVEFVEAHHTPKNTLLYGHQRNRSTSRDPYVALKDHLGGAGIALEGRV